MLPETVWNMLRGEIHEHWRVRRSTGSRVAVGEEFSAHAALRVCRVGRFELGKAAPVYRKNLYCRNSYTTWRSNRLAWELTNVVVADRVLTYLGKSG